MARTKFVILFYAFFALTCRGDAIPGGFRTTKISPKPIWNATYTDKLKQDLLLNYDKFARPTQHYNTTRVTIGMTIRHIDIDEFKSSISVNALVKMDWVDEKLKWNSSDYGGITQINFADHEIWQPDILLYNSAAGNPVNHLGGTHCVASQNGEIVWTPPAQFTALCGLDLKLWPFDTQICRLKLGSWTYNGNEIDLQVDNPPNIELEHEIPNSEWRIVKVNATRNEAYYQCCPEPYVDATFEFTVARRTASYQSIIITPAFVIIIMTLVSFWLPPQAGEKIVINGCTALIISIFMIYFTQKIPAMGYHTPLIVIFYSSSLYISALSMIGSVVVIWLSRTPHSRALPWTIKKPLTGTFGKLLGLDSYITQPTLQMYCEPAEEMRDHRVQEFEDHHTSTQRLSMRQKPSHQLDWILLAVAVDRILFSVYSVLFAILAIVYSI